MENVPLPFDPPLHEHRRYGDPMEVVKATLELFPGVTKAILVSRDKTPPVVEARVAVLIALQAASPVHRSCAWLGRFIGRSGSTVTHLLGRNAKARRRPSTMERLDRLGRAHLARQQGT